MPLLKKIVKNDPREVIVKWTGTGTDTLTLASLVSPGQTLTGIVGPGVNIVGMTSSVGTGTVTVTRNAEVALLVYGYFEFQTDGIIQAVINENSKFDIVVALSTAGTLILRLRKSQGYSGA